MGWVMVASLTGPMLNPKFKVLFFYAKDWPPAATLGFSRISSTDLVSDSRAH